MNTMNNSPLGASTAYVAGHRGLAGSAVVRRSECEGCNKILVRTHNKPDMTDQTEVARFFAKERPEYVFLAATKVGGILASNTRPADFISDNLAIQASLIRAAYEVGVQRLLFLGFSCIYLRDCPQSIREEYMLTGPLESTNRPYAVAKIAGIEMCWAFNRQYGTQYISAMPTNLSGPNDNYDLAGSHVLPALLRKMPEAKLSDAAEGVVWGTGKVRREFLHTDDMADACVFLMNLPGDAYGPIAGSESQVPLLNIGCGEDVTVQELAGLIRDVVGFQERLIFDISKPDGTPRKLLDVSRKEELGWHATVPLREGLAAVYRQYVSSTALHTTELQH
jgi:GDP-L-fucose synthase